MEATVVLSVSVDRHRQCPMKEGGNPKRRSGTVFPIVEAMEGAAFDLSLADLGTAQVRGRENPSWHDEQRGVSL